MMSETSQSTTASSQAGQYERAETISVQQPARTIASTQDMRTIATRLTDGELVIRYTPRDTSPSGGETR